VGIAVFDKHLRYCIVNPYLALSNCTSIESHLGKHVREILGSVGVQVERAIQQVFATGKPLLNCEFKGALPTKPHGHWADNFFPIMDANGSVAYVGVLVAELERDTTIQSSLESHSPTVLRSWKDIARYVGTCVKTVQRWELSHAFPVRRVSKSKGAVVFALQDEVDSWLRTRRVDANG
jgi:hypothetical protein